MTNIFQTHRLIVTLPNTTGEEVDQIAAEAEAYIADETPGATVTHALGESLPPDTSCYILGDLIVIVDDIDSERIVLTSAHEARELAGVLLAHADQLEA